MALWPAPVKDELRQQEYLGDGTKRTAVVAASARFRDRPQPVEVVCGFCLKIQLKRKFKKQLGVERGAGVTAHGERVSKTGGGRTT